MVAVVLVVMVKVKETVTEVVVTVVLGALVSAFQQTLFSVFLTISQGTTQSISSIQLCKRLRVAYLHFL